MLEVNLVTSAGRVLFCSEVVFLGRKNLGGRFLIILLISPLKRADLFRRSNSKSGFFLVIVYLLEFHFFREITFAKEGKMLKWIFI